MARSHDIITNPIVGDKVEFLVTAADSGGELLRLQVWIAPGAQGPPEHTHPVQVETFAVVSGTAGLKVNGQTHLLSAGQSLTVPNNTPHKFWNAGPDELVMIGELRPAFRTEYFLESMYSLASQGKVNRNAVPRNIFQFAAILNDCYGEFFLVGPPVFAQRLLAKGVGRLGKWLGYQGFVPFGAP
jgi:mannose-6-phosphate isomerase-like protein (cupin superfamily)